MADLQPSQSLSIHHADIGDVLNAFFCKAKALSWGEIFFILLLTMLVMVGNALQVISLNFWLRDFGPGGASKFTAFAVSNLFFFLFFLVIFIIYYIKNRPDLSFMWTKKSMWLLILIGFGDMLNSELNLYATVGTPEILQTLFNSTQPIFCFIFSRWILNDKRHWANWWCLGSFVLMIAGVCIASGPDFADSNSMSTSKKWWSFIFFVSTPLQSWYNVVQSQYMEQFTDKDKKDGEGQQQNGSDGGYPTTASLGNNADAVTVNESMDGGILASSPTPNDKDMSSLDGDAAIASSDRVPLIAKSAATYGSAGQQQAPTSAEEGNSNNNACCCCGSCCCDSCNKHWDDHPKGSDEAVKIVMLLGDTFFQFVLCMFAMPADTIPWYGESDSVGKTWSNFVDGLKCVFTCKNNGLYALAYVSGFISLYVGCAYLNAYSPTLCSMLQQLAGPVTAIILLINPSWNLNAGSASWYFTVIAIVVLLVATCVYSVWEEMSVLEEEEEERVEHLKEERHSQQQFLPDDESLGDAVQAAHE